MPTIVMTGEDTFKFIDDGRPAQGGAENYTYYSSKEEAPEEVRKIMDAPRATNAPWGTYGSTVQQPDAPAPQVQQQVQQPTQQQRAVVQATGVTAPGAVRYNSQTGVMQQVGTPGPKAKQTWAQAHQAALAAQGKGKKKPLVAATGAAGPAAAPVYVGPNSAAAMGIAPTTALSRTMAQTPALAAAGPAMQGAMQGATGLWQRAMGQGSTQPPTAAGVAAAPSGYAPPVLSQTIAQTPALAAAAPAARGFAETVGPAAADLWRRTMGQGRPNSDAPPANRYNTAPQNDGASANVTANAINRGMEVLSGGPMPSMMTSYANLPGRYIEPVVQGVQNIGTQASSAGRLISGAVQGIQSYPQEVAQGMVQDAASGVRPVMDSNYATGAAMMGYAPSGPTNYTPSYVSGEQQQNGLDWSSVPQQFGGRPQEMFGGTGRTPVSINPPQPTETYQNYGSIYDMNRQYRDPAPQNNIQNVTIPQADPSRSVPMVQMIPMTVPDYNPYRRRTYLPQGY